MSFLIFLKNRPISPTTKQNLHAYASDMCMQVTHSTRASFFVEVWPLEYHFHVSLQMTTRSALSQETKNKDLHKVTLSVLIPHL